MLEIAHTAIQAHSFEEAVDFLAEKLHYRFSQSFVWEITNFVGYVILNERNRRINRLVEAIMTGDLYDIIPALYPNCKKADILYSLIDGSFVNTRSTNVNKNSENTSNWRECKMCMTFKPEDLIKRRTKKSTDERYTIGKSDYAAYIGRKDDFKYVFLDLMLQNGTRKGSTVVLISDGADWIYNMVLDMLKPIGVTIVAINDLFHTKQNIGKFCQSVNESAKAKGEEPPLSADNLIELVENGEIETALALLKPFADYKFQGIVNAYSYILERKSRMNYPAYRTAGYFVGSGPVESANKYYIQNRMKGPGMAWAIECGQRILILRGYDISGQWECVGDIMTQKRDCLLSLKERFLQEEIKRIQMKMKPQSEIELW